MQKVYAACLQLLSATSCCISRSMGTRFLSPLVQAGNAPSPCCAPSSAPNSAPLATFSPTVRHINNKRTMVEIENITVCEIVV